MRTPIMGKVLGSYNWEKLRRVVSAGMLAAITSLSSSCIGNEGSVNVAGRSAATAAAPAGEDTRNFAVPVAGEFVSVPIGVTSDEALFHDLCMRDPVSVVCDSFCSSYRADSACTDLLARRSSAITAACSSAPSGPVCSDYCPRHATLRLDVQNCPVVRVVSVRPEDAEMSVEVRERPVSAPSNLSRPYAISAGPQHSCGIALTASGSQTVACWGRNHRGQLGNNSRVDSRTPVQVQGLPVGAQVLQVVAGGNPEQTSAFSCALIGLSGSLKVAYCWGSNSFGELGIGNYSDRPTAGFITFAYGLPQRLAAGFTHVCATILRSATGRIGAQCWGQNQRGQLGIGTVGFSTPASGTPLIVQAAGPDYLQNQATLSVWEHFQWTGKISLSAQGNHTCMDSGASVRTSRLICWGENANQEIARHDLEDVTCGPVGNTGRCISLAGGAAGAAATISVDRGSTTPSEGLSPGELFLFTGGAIGVDERMLFAVGVRHVCAMTTEGMRCYGNNENGALGVNPSVFPNVPAPPALRDTSRDVPTRNLIDPIRGGEGFSRSVLEVRAGNDMTCVRLVNQSVYCWGWNVTGSLGRSPNEILSAWYGREVMGRGLTGAGWSPAQIALSSFNGMILWRGTENPSRIEVGANRSLNPVYGLGRNDYGQLGFAPAPNAGNPLSLTWTPTPALP